MRQSRKELRLEARYVPMKKNPLILFLPFVFLCLSIPAALAQDILWVTSERAKLKTASRASSETITAVPIGTEVTVLTTKRRWHKIRIPSGEEGWMYRGRLSETPPQKEAEDETGNLFAALGGSKIQADEADTARSIRGRSSETEQYARLRGTPAAYERALDRVLAISVTENELDVFLRQGKIGEYAP